MRKHLIICMMAGLWLCAGAAAAVEEQEVRSHKFEIDVAPLSEADYDAITADLFITTQPGAGWRFAGECSVVRSSEKPLFRKVLSVPADGVYYLRSRAGDAAGKSDDPAPADAPQVKVVVDTTDPLLSIVTPTGEEEVRPGDKLRINWNAADSNFPEKPIRILYSDDGGADWKPASGDTENDGFEEWTVPALNSEALLLKLIATDRAGNTSTATIRRPVRVLPPVAEEPKPAPKAEEPPPPPAPKTPPAEQPAGNGQTATKKAEKGDEPKFPWLDANDANLAKDDWRTYSPKYDAYTSYVMAGNLARQGRLKDSLRYYNEAVERDEKFGDAWNDLALVYKQLGSYDKGYRCAAKALELYPTNPVYSHTAGEVMQDKGFWLLRNELGDEDHAKAVQSIHFALKFYADAIELSERQGTLGERAATFFRIGEICYFYNKDLAGARRYWEKVLSLHTPTPELDTVIHDEGTPREQRTREIYQRQTEMKVRLRTWQEWTAAYLRQLDAYERNSSVQAAPVGAESQNRLQPVPPAAGDGLNEAPEIPKLPEGNADYCQPGYGSQSQKRQPGEVQRDIPTPSAERKTPPAPTKRDAPAETGTDWQNSAEYYDYGKYSGEGASTAPVAPAPAAPGYVDYSRW